MVSETLKMWEEKNAKRSFYFLILSFFCETFWSLFKYLLLGKDDGLSSTTNNLRAPASWANKRQFDIFEWQLLLQSKSMIN